MFAIEEKGENLFALTKYGVLLGEFLTFKDAQTAQYVAEGHLPTSTGTWVDDGEGLGYPDGTDGYHSGVEATPLTFEERFDEVLRYLEKVHGFHLPSHLAPTPSAEV